MVIERRIVPMHGAIQVTAAPPHLTYGGGPLLTAVQVYTIFWGASCQQMCGYHWYIAGPNPQVIYAVMPFPGCGGCLGGLTQIEALTSISSHELCEAITDPQPWTGWNDSSNGEIGDICSWQTQVLGGYTVQKEWSNKANTCAVQPAVASLAAVGSVLSS